jgi:pimeloyl-ACP methyl ester carboxylesterase
MKGGRRPRTRRWRARPALVLTAALAALSLAACQDGGRRHVTETCLYGKVNSADGVEIRYECQGEGDPTLVFVHCWCGDRDYWRRQLESFRGEHRVVALDLAGHGESAAGREHWTIDAFAEDVAVVCEKLDLRGAILVGHSLGGPVAVEAARRLPERVIGVIGIDTLHDLGRHYPDEQIEAFLAPMREDFRGTVRSFVRSMFPAGSDTALVASLADDMAEEPPAVAVAALADYLRHDLVPAVRELHVPIRCINADTYPINLEANRRLAGSFEAVVMEGVGHFPQLERPAEFDAHLAATVAGIVAARTAGEGEDP